MEFDIEKCQYIDDMPTPFFAIEVLDNERHDPDNFIIRYSNKAHNTLVGLKKEEVEDQPFWKMFQVMDASQTEIYRETVKNNESRRMDRYNEQLGKFVRVMTYPLAPHICGSMIEVISDYQDNLMGCLNLKGFQQRAAQIMGKNPEQAYAFWYCDIKQFKYVNDNFGYVEGDYILKIIGEKLTSILGKDELMGRVTGDIFVLMAKFVSEETSEQRFHAAVKSVVDTYQERWRQHYDLKLAGGVYVYRPGESERRSVSRYLDYANSARKQAKRVKGGNCVEFFKKEMWEKERRWVEISHHLKQAIEDGEIQPWFQPQYDYRHGKLIGAEVLTRWVHPEYGNIYPDEFIHVLEESGQILELDAYIWECACQYIRKWQDAGYRMPLSINLSRKDVHGHGLLEQLVELTNKYEIDRELLHLEITESAYMDNPEELIEIVEKLTLAGFRVEMDDFGSGYSSLNMLKNVPVQTIKLDLRFIDDLEDNSKAGNIISSVVRMAHGLGMGVISEGVETRQQADFLKNLGCDLMQGYYFSKPLPIEEFEKKCMTRLGDMTKVPAPQMLNMDLIQEFLRANNNSSFIFNHCVGAGAVMEYDGTKVQIVLANDKFSELNGASTDELNVADLNEHTVFLAEDAEKVAKCIKQTIAHGEAKCKVFMKPSAKWVEIRDTLITRDGVSALIFTQLEDVTQEHFLQEELRKVQEKHEWKQQQFQALAHMPGVITYDYNPCNDLLNLDYTNQNGEVREFIVEDFLGKIDQHPWLAPESAAAHKAAYEEAMQRPMTGFVDFMGCFEGEEFYYYRSYYTSVADASGKIYRIVGRADKIDKDVKKVQRLQKRAEHDSLTGLLNYESLVKHLEYDMALLKCGALLIIDIDHFKSVNDRFGHMVGNKMLKAVSDVFTEMFRQSDVIARFGGDEFVIFLPNITDAALVQKKGEQLLAAIHQIQVSEGEYLSVSIGGAIISDESVSASQMLKTADKALYRAKDAGRNRIELAVEISGGSVTTGNKG